jgi:uncharacterized Zn finger protein
VEPEPLPVDPDLYWGKSLEVTIFHPMSAAIPQIDAALPKRLGKFPFWRGNSNIQDLLIPIYHNASSAGLRVFLGENDNTL